MPFLRPEVCEFELFYLSFVLGFCAEYGLKYRERIFFNTYKCLRIDGNKSEPSVKKSRTLSLGLKWLMQTQSQLTYHLINHWSNRLIDYRLKRVIDFALITDRYIFCCVYPFSFKTLVNMLAINGLAMGAQEACGRPKHLSNIIKWMNGCSSGGSGGSGLSVQSSHELFQTKHKP